MCLNTSALRTKRTPLQVHHTDAAQLPRRLLRPVSRPIFDWKIQGNRIETKIQIPIELDDSQNGAQYDDEHDSRIQRIRNSSSPARREPVGPRDCPSSPYEMESMDFSYKLFKKPFSVWITSSVARYFSKLGCDLMQVIFFKRHYLRKNFVSLFVCHLRLRKTKLKLLFVIYINFYLFFSFKLKLSTFKLSRGFTFCKYLM